MFQQLWLVVRHYISTFNFTYATMQKGMYCNIGTRLDIKKITAIWTVYKLAIQQISHFLFLYNDITISSIGKVAHKSARAVYTTHVKTTKLYRGSGSGWPSCCRTSTSSPMGLLIEHRSKMSLPINWVIMKSCTNSSAWCLPWHNQKHVEKIEYK